MEVFNTNLFYYHFCCAMLCKRCYASVALAVMHCLSICLSVCLSRSYIMSKRINLSSIFFTGSHTILFFSVLNVVAMFWRNPPPNGGVECTYRVGRNRDSDPISGLVACCERCDGQLLYQHDRRPIPGYRSMPAGASAINWRWSVQWCITDCHGTSLLTAQKGTQQWLRRREDKRT